MSEEVALISRYDPSNELLKVIVKKRKVLVRLTKKVEQLDSQLQEIQAEYDQKIGTLFRRSSLLDREIDYHKAINAFIEQGLTYEQAVAKLSEELEQKNNYTEEFFVFDEEEESKEEKQDENSLRRLWKKLMQQHHPDLASNSKTKKEKEALTKVINNAYKAGDFKLLQSIEERDLGATIADTTSTGLQKLLVDLENAIIRKSVLYKNLQKSEWYSWRKKTEKEKNELFKELQRSLIREILHKEFVLSQLKKKQQFL